MEETPRDQREVSPTRIILLSYTYPTNDYIITLKREFNSTGLTQSVTAPGAFMVITGGALGGTGAGAVLLERPYALEILISGKPVAEGGLDNSLLLSV